MALQNVEEGDGVQKAQNDALSETRQVSDLMQNRLGSPKATVRPSPKVEGNSESPTP